MSKQQLSHGLFKLALHHNGAAQTELTLLQFRVMETSCLVQLYALLFMSFASREVVVRRLYWSHLLVVLGGHVTCMCTAVGIYYTVCFSHNTGTGLC